MSTQDQYLETHSSGSRLPHNREPAPQAHGERPQDQHDDIKHEEIKDSTEVKKEETPPVSIAATSPHHGWGSSDRTSPVRVKKEETSPVHLADIPPARVQNFPMREISEWHTPERDPVGRTSPRKTRRIDYRKLSDTGARMEKN